MMLCAPCPERVLRLQVLAANVRQLANGSGHQKDLIVFRATPGFPTDVCASVLRCNGHSCASI